MQRDCVGGGGGGGVLRGRRGKERCTIRKASRIPDRSNTIESPDQFPHVG